MNKLGKIYLTSILIIALVLSIFIILEITKAEEGQEPISISQTEFSDTYYIGKMNATIFYCSNESINDLGECLIANETILNRTELRDFYTTSISGGQKNYFDAGWKKFKDNVFFNKHGNDFNITVKDKFGIKFEVLPMRNNITYTWNQVFTAYPNMSYNIISHSGNLRIKFDLNFTNCDGTENCTMGAGLPSGSQLKFNLINSWGITYDDIEKVDDGLIFYNKFKLEIPLSCNALINKNTLILNNLSKECLDPTVKLTAGNITEDGDVDDTSARDNTATTMEIGKTIFGTGPVSRGYIEFNTSAIPDTATITDVDLNVSVNTSGLNANVNNIEAQVGSQTNANLYADIANGTAYISNNAFTGSTGWKNLDLGTTADNDTQNQLSVDWFAVGIKQTTETLVSSLIDTVESASDPELVVTYTLPYPLVSFVSPTPTDQTTSANTSFIFNATIDGTSSLNNVTWTWNQTNFTIYDDRLMLMLNFDNVTALGENATRAVDLSKYSNNGTFYNGATWTTSGKYGSGVSFDGVNDYMQVSDSNSLDFNSAGFTVSFWFNIQGNNSNISHQVLLNKNNEYYLRYINNTKKIQFNLRYNNSLWMPIVQSTSALNFGTWNYIIGTWNGSQQNLYINGVSEATHNNVSTVTGTTNAMNIGNWDATNMQKVNGTIDEVRIYNRSLSANEVYQLYASNLQKFNLTRYIFYSNQSNLVGGVNYTYRIGACDTSNNCNLTSLRYLNITVSPSINLNLIVPATSQVNVTQNQFFNVTVNVSCSNANCGEINVTLMGNISTSTFLLNGTNITEDGDINWLNPSYARENTTTTIRFYFVNVNNIFRGYIQFNTSAIPDTATINDVDLNVSLTAATSDNCEVRQIEMQTASQTNANLYADIGNGTAYLDNNNFCNLTTGWKNLDLGTTADSDLQNQLSADWFAVGIKTEEAVGIIGPAGISSSESASDPELVVTYTTSGVVSTTIGATPFYTNESNPRNITLNSGENQTVVFYVNATGGLNTNHTFFVYANKTADMSINNITNKWNVTIVSATAPDTTILTGCGNLTTPNTIYTLNQSVSSTGICFTISANNVTLDGNLSIITYGTGTGAKTFGVLVTNNSNFTTIKNSIITQGNAAGNYKYGIFLNSSSNSTIRNNTINTTGNYAAGILLNMTSNSNVLANNNITTKLTGTSIYAYGIYLDKELNNIIANNTITTSGGNGYSYGIYLPLSSNLTTISNNTITTFGAYSYGVYMSGLSSNNNLINNTITTSGGNGRGISMESSNQNNLTSNTIRTSGGSGYGIYLLTSSNSSTIKNNSIITSGSSGIGIYLYNGPTGNIIKENIVKVNGTSAFGIYLQTGITANNNLINNTVNSLLTYAIYMNGAGLTASRNLIYNNILNASANSYSTSTSFLILNKTKTSATNIIAGSNVAGNFWTNKLGQIYPTNYGDADGDGIVDKAYDIYRNRACGAGTSFACTAATTDYLPLTDTDATIPSVSITSPVNNTYVNGVVTITATASDNRGVKNVTFYYKNSSVDWTGFCSDTTSLYTCSWNTALFGNNSEGYDIRAIAFDYFENNNTDNRHYIIDRVRPNLQDITVIYPTGQESVRDNQNVALKINVTDSTYVQAGMNLTRVDLTQINATGNITMNFESGSLSTGQWSIWNITAKVDADVSRLPGVARIYVYDNATPLNNQRNGDVFNVMIDNNVTTYSGAGDTGATFNNTDATFFVDVFDNFKLENYIFSENSSGSWVNLSGSLSGTSYSIAHVKRVYTGNFSYKFYIYDDAGNVNETPINNVEISGPAPVFAVYLNNPLNNNISAVNTINFTFYYENGVATSCSLYINGEVNDSLNSPANYTILGFNEILSDGDYTWNVGCLDSESGNTYLTEVRNILIDTTFPLISIEYPTNVTYSSSVSELNYTITEANSQACWYSTDSGAINHTITCGENVTTMSSAAGSNIWKVWANDTIGHLNSSQVIFSIAFPDAIYPVFSSYYDDNSSLAGSGITHFNVTVVNTNGTVLLQINYTNYTASNLTEQRYNVSFSLINGTYEYYWISWGNGTLKNFNISEAREYTINNSIDTEYPLFSNFLVNPANNTGYYPNILFRLNATIISSNGSAGIEFNGVNYTVNNLTSTFFNSTIANLGTGIYPYYWWAYSNGTNHYYNVSGLKGYTISQSTGNISLFLNHTQANITITNDTSIWLNATLVNGSGAIQLYKNGTIINNGTSPLSNLTNFTGIGIYNITAVYLGNTNYTYNAKEFYVNSTAQIVPDTTAPLVTILSPTNKTYASSTIYFNFTLNENGTCRYSLNFGVNNYSMTGNATGTHWNATNSSIADGGYVVHAYCNDTSGNRNYSESLAFSKDTVMPLITIISPLNATYNVTSVDFNVSLSEAGTWCSFNLDGTGFKAANTMTLINSTYFNYTKSSLTDGTQHNLIFKCNDTTGNMNSSSETVYFIVNTTVAPAEITPPTITNILATPSTRSATITWTTNENANSTVTYDSTASGSATLTTSHSISLAGLTPATTYTYSVSSCDAAGNCATDGGHVFATLSEGDGGCTELWSCSGWSNCVQGIQSRICTDAHLCGTTLNKPAENQTCASCPEQTTKGPWSDCVDNMQTRTIRHTYTNCTQEITTENQTCTVSVEITFTPQNPKLTINDGGVINFETYMRDRGNNPTDFTVEWYVDRELIKTNTGQTTLTSKLDRTFTGIGRYYIVKSKATYLDIEEDYTWGVEVIECNAESCIENWRCTWSECDDYNMTYAERCIDLSNCCTNLQRPIRRQCGCLAMFECTNWSDCEADYDLNNLIEGDILIQGKKTMSCVDIQKCENSTINYKSCNLSIPIRAEKTIWCNDTYIEIFDIKQDKLVARLKETSILDFKKIDIGFIQTAFKGYCEYCRDGIKDYDEENVDCGGPSCPACGFGRFYMIPRWLVILLLLTIINYLIYLFVKENELN